jgi:hypothetical protein
MKPWLLYNWPQSKLDHEELTLKITKVFNEQRKGEHKIGKVRPEFEMADINVFIDEEVKHLNKVDEENKDK